MRLRSSHLLTAFICAALASLAHPVLCCAQAPAPALVLKGHGIRAEAITFSPDGSVLASGGAKPELTSGGDTDVLLWNVKTGKVMAKLSGHTRTVTSLAFSPDGKCLASGSEDGTLRLWDVASGKNVLTIKDKGVLWCVAYHPDGQSMFFGGQVLGENSGIKIWDLAEGKMREELRGTSRNVRSLSFSPGGKHLVTCDAELSVVLWDIPSRKEIAVLQDNKPKARTTGRGEVERHWSKGGGTGAVFHADGKSVVCFDPTERGELLMWKVESKPTITRRLGLPKFSQGRILFGMDDIAMHPEGKVVAVAGLDLWIWPLDSDDFRARFDPLDIRGGFHRIAFSPNSTFLAAAGSENGEISLWSLPIQPKK